MILEVDFSTLEIRVAAFLSQDPIMCEEVRNDVDFHTDNAVRFFGTKDKRREAKAATFALQYGASPFGISRTTGISLSSAEQFVEGYYDKYRVLRDWHQKNIKLVAMKKPIVLPTGRYYTFKREKNEKGELVFPVTKIKNYPVQGFATGDIVPLAARYAFNRVRKFCNQTILCMIVHDSTVWDTPKEKCKDIARIVLQTYQDTPKLLQHVYGFEFNLPLTGEAKAGPTWGSVEKLEI